MKIVYTPIFEDKGSYLSNDLYNRRFFDIACFLLSVTLIKEFYDHIEIRTTPDFSEFIKRVFPDVVLINQDTQPYGDHNWQMNKIISYCKQDEPFIHIDHDVFISQRPELDWWNAGFFTQSFETAPNKQSVLRSAYNSAKMRGQKFPEYTDARAKSNIWSQYNMGIFGCVDLDSCKQFCSDIISCVGHGSSFHGQAMVYEQYSFTAFAETNNLPVMTFLDENSLESDAAQKGYCHLMGGKGKINTMAQTIDSLGRHNPEALYALYKNYNPKNGKDIPKSFPNWAIVGNAEVLPLEDLTI